MMGFSIMGDEIVVYLIGGEKGGSGRSTLATSLSALRAIRGHDVLLVDTDIQKSTTFWAGIREEAGIQPRVPTVEKTGKGVQAEIRDLATRYQDIIVDAGGKDNPELRSSLVACDKVYIPVQCSQFDLWSCQKMHELVNTAKDFNGKLEAFLVITRAPTNRQITEVQEAREFLSEFDQFNICETVIHERVAWRKAIRLGKSVCELNDNKAKAELELLYEEIFHG